MGPFSGLVEYAKDCDNIFGGMVDNSIRGISDYQLPCIMNPSRPAQQRLIDQKIDNIRNALRYFPGSGRIFRCNIIPQGNQISQGFLFPPYPHFGHSTSSSVPQVDNHCATSS